MLENQLETDIGSPEEGLRILAQIIASAYMRDIRDKTATKDAKQSQTKGLEKDNQNKKGKICQRKRQ